MLLCTRAAHNVCWNALELEGCCSCRTHVPHVHLHNEACSPFVGPLSRVGLLVARPSLLSIGIWMVPSPHLTSPHRLQGPRHRQAGYGKEGKWCDGFVLVRLPSPQGSPLKIYQLRTGEHQVTFSLDVFSSSKTASPGLAGRTLLEHR